MKPRIKLSRGKTMARRETRDEAIARAKRLECDNTVLMLALNYVEGRPDHAEDWTDRDGEGRYRAKLYGANRADGGIVVIAFTHPQNKRPHVVACYLDEWHGQCKGGTLLAEQVAAENMCAARSKIWRIRDHEMHYPSPAHN